MDELEPVRPTPNRESSMILPLKGAGRQANELALTLIHGVLPVGWATSHRARRGRDVRPAGPVA